MLRLASEDSSGCANFDPDANQDEEKVGDFTESQHCAAEYQAERSTDITHQSQHRVRRFSLDVRVLQLREKHLVTIANSSICHALAVHVAVIFAPGRRVPNSHSIVVVVVAIQFYSKNP